MSRSTIRSQRRKSASSSTAPSSWSTACTVDLAAGRGGELVERRDGVAEAAARAAGDQRERRVGRLDPLAVGDAPQQLRRAPASRGRAKTNVWQRERTVGSTLRELGRAEDEDEVGRRLLDQLQERVPGGVRELVRLVEDVDLVAALDRLEDDALADLADVVDAALARRRPSRSRRATCRSRS